MLGQELLQDKENLMRRCYELCLYAEWDPHKLYGRPNMTVSVIKKYAREYIENVLKQPLTKEQIWFFFSGKERALFDTYHNIIKEMIKLNIINREQLKNVEWVHENFRFLIYKFCFDVSEQRNWIKEEIENYCAENGVNIYTFKNASDTYIDEVLKWDESQKEEHRQKKYELRKKHMRENISGKYAVMFKKLLEMNDNAQIINFLGSFEKRPGQIRDRLADFITVYYDGSKEIKENLERKIKIYADYVNEIRCEEKAEQKAEKQAIRADENFKVAHQVINQYLDGKYERQKDFCYEQGITIKEFNEYVVLIKEKDEELYNKYSSYVADIKSKRFKTILATAKRIVELIKTGVNENGVIRDFDIVDYYRCTKLTFEEFLNIIKGNIGVEDYRTLRIFMAKYQYDKEMSSKDLENLYNTKTIVGAQFDKKGNLIPGTGREITNEDKQNIIKYLRDNNILVTNRTYDIVYRRWLSGKLVINEEEKDKKK